MKKKKKLVAIVFIILLTLGMFPWPFTANPEPYIFGWLPFPVFYWWVLMFVNLAFVLWVAKVFVAEAKEEKKGKNENDQKQADKKQGVTK